ncbi:hypothetical protein H5V45_13210 [Nocardioides sp. KIGAM211]|uniref:Uncharacterized protein n=1 Tax=Nocardioides luti TaxID=2761101 RepID=A0A7X0RJ81_9ACTN|nr:hypothetical protein [Nocardioides luti]MBB6628280.1 hypothetical protein [Nocardioides luti]
MRSRYAVPLAVLALALTGCGGDDPAPGAGGEPTASASSSASTSPSPTDDPTPGESTSASPSETAGGGVGTAEDPEPLDAGKALLDWTPVPGSVTDTVTRGGGWTLTVDELGKKAELSSDGASAGTATDKRHRISDALLDGRYAVVVVQDKRETQPAVATVYDLGKGAKSFTLDGSSDVPTVTGGTWALGEGHLVHATVRDGAYCAATVDLATQKSTIGWCAPDRSGFNAARITPAGDSLLTFDDSRPSCRTVVALSGTGTTPFPGVPACTAWEGLVTDDGAVWAVVPKPRRVEEAVLYAHTGDSWLDLGPGTSGSLTWCAGAAYFVRDPQTDGSPAALMRFDGTALDVVYESSGPQSFVASPRCGGDTLTITSLSEDGDEQVSADLG